MDEVKLKPSRQAARAFHEIITLLAIAFAVSLSSCEGSADMSNLPVDEIACEGNREEKKQSIAFIDKETRQISDLAVGEVVPGPE